MNVMDHKIFQINAFRLPPGGPERESRVPSAYWREGYLEQFDRHTLFYDAIALPAHLILIAPKLNNLEAVLRKTLFSHSGQTLRIKRIKKYRRHDEIILSHPKNTQEKSTLQIEMCLDSAKHIIQLSQTAFSHFSGRNTAAFMMRNDDLDWVRDYVAYYRKIHKLDALMIIDNGSTLYDAQEISQMLRQTGLSKTGVISAPYLYGPRGRKPYARAEKYLQTAMLNILRLRFFAKARAVMICDIDELAYSPEGTIFDLTYQSKLGLQIWPGLWRYPGFGFAGFAPHSAHVFAHEPEQNCSPKWCIRPNGPLRHFRWDVHGLQRFGLGALLPRRQGRFWHCRHVTTGWKSGRQNRANTNLHLDETMQKQLAQVFKSHSDQTG